MCWVLNFWIFFVKVLLVWGWDPGEEGMKHCSFCWTWLLYWPLRLDSTQQGNARDMLWFSESCAPRWYGIIGTITKMIIHHQVMYLLLWGYHQYHQVCNHRWLEIATFVCNYAKQGSQCPSLKAMIFDEFLHDVCCTKPCDADPRVSRVQNKNR